MTVGHILRCHQIIDVDFVRGSNCRLWDAQGRRYLDLESGSWSAVLGHGNPRIDGIIAATAGGLLHLGVRTPNHVAEEAAVGVLGATGLGEGKCVFLSSGSEAVELAVQAALRCTGRPLLLGFAGSYLAAYGTAGRKGADQWILLDRKAAERGDPEEAVKGIPLDRVAAFVLEPGGGSPEFARFPSKPLVETVAARVVAEALERGGFRYAQSHQNTPLGCAVAPGLREGGPRPGHAPRGGAPR